MDVSEGMVEKLRDETGLNIVTPPFIDVFVLEGVPDNVREINRWWKSRRMLRMCQLYRYPESANVTKEASGKLRKRLARFAGAFLSLFYPATKSNDDMMLLFDECARRWSYNDSIMVAEPAFFRFRFSRIYHKSVFEPARTVKFEDGTICVPAKVEEYLTQFFGNYMEPPPIEQRIPEHILRRTFSHA